MFCLFPPEPTLSRKLPNMFRDGLEFTNLCARDVFFFFSFFFKVMMMMSVRACLVEGQQLITITE